MRMPAGRPRLAVALALVAVSAALASASDALRATPRAPGGLGSLLGGLSAVVAQGAWIRAEAALAERRDADALYYLDLITELEPQLVAAADHIADEIGANRAREFPDPVARWSFVREGLRILDGCVEHNPGVTEAHHARGRYLLLRIAPAAELRALHGQERGGGVIEAAVEDLEEAHRSDPAAADVLETLGVGLKLLGDKRFFGDGDAPRAAVAYRRAAAVYRLQEEVFRDVPEALEAKRRVLAYVEGLAAVAEAPAARRKALYGAFRKDFEAAFPDLPPLRERPGGR
jgi:hypothetical protein